MDGPAVTEGESVLNAPLGYKWPWFPVYEITALDFTFQDGTVQTLFSETFFGYVGMRASLGWWGRRIVRLFRRGK